MINKNGGLFYGSIIDYGTLSSVLTDINGDTMTSNIVCDRSYGSRTGNTYPTNNNAYSLSIIRTFARIGYGNTLPTINDYCLENEESNGVNINDVVYCTVANISYGLYSQYGTSPSITQKIPDGTLCYTYTFYNNSDNDITFYEIGQFVNPVASASSIPFMTMRCVNPNGWTVKARENITLTLEMDFCCGTVLGKQGGRYITSGFDYTTSILGFIDYQGNAISGVSISLKATGTNSNSQAATDNSYTTQATQGVFARLGVGQTAVTATDYCVENEILSDDSNINSVVVCRSATLYTNRTGDGNGKWVYSYTFENTGSTSITAYEIGLFVRISGVSFMLGRKVNESGWTFASGETKTINFEIEICGATNDMERPINNG